LPGPEPGPEQADPIDDFWGFDEPPARRRRESLLRLVARIALVAFLIAFPLGIVVDSFYRSSFPEASLAVVEVVLVGAVALWLRSLRRRR
jgi:undecaprenyl pyrophosphate phosphatase UppP